MSLVKSETIYNTQSYCNEFLDFCPIISGEKDELRTKLDHNGYDDLWDYPLSEIDEIVKNKHEVVLVDCSYVGENENGEYETIQEFRWFEIP